MATVLMRGCRVIAFLLTRIYWSPNTRLVRIFSFTILQNGYPKPHYFENLYRKGYAATDIIWNFIWPCVLDNAISDMLIQNKLYTQIIVSQSENLYQIGLLINIQKMHLSKLTRVILQQSTMHIHE